MARCVVGAGAECVVAGGGDFGLAEAVLVVDGAAVLVVAPSELDVDELDVDDELGVWGLNGHVPARVLRRVYRVADAADHEQAGEDHQVQNVFGFRFRNGSLGGCGGW